MKKVLTINLVYTVKVYPKAYSTCPKTYMKPAHLHAKSTKKIKRVQNMAIFWGKIEILEHFLTKMYTLECVFVTSFVQNGYETKKSLAFTSFFIKSTMK